MNLTEVDTRFIVIAEVELEFQNKIDNLLIQTYLDDAGIDIEGEVIVSVVIRLDSPTIKLIEYEDDIACVSIPIDPAMARLLTQEGIATVVASLAKMILDSPHLLAEGEDNNEQPTA